MPRRRPPHTYFALLALIAFEQAVVAIPGGPFFGSVTPLGIAAGVGVLVMLGRGSRVAWWLATAVAALGAASAPAVPFTGPESGLMTGIDRIDTGIWLACIVATFVLLVSPSMRGYVRRGAARPA